MTVASRFADLTPSAKSLVAGTILMAALVETEIDGDDPLALYQFFSNLFESADADGPMLAGEDASEMRTAIEVWERILNEQETPEPTETTQGAEQPPEREA